MGRASGFEKRITGLIAAQGRGLDDQPDLKQARRNCVTVTRILQTAARVSVLWLRVCCMSLGVGVWVTWGYEMDRGRAFGGRLALDTCCWPPSRRPR